MCWEDLALLVALACVVGLRGSQMCQMRVEILKMRRVGYSFIILSNVIYSKSMLLSRGLLLVPVENLYYLSVAR